MDFNDLSDERPELRVTFSPNLYLQRRGWVLNQLRHEHVTQVLDVGCGEGELLACLCQPAPWLPPPPADSLPDAASGSIYSDPSTSTRLYYYPVPNTLPDKIANLHPSHLAGLDVSQLDLQIAVEGTAPRPAMHWHENVRWEPLKVDIWKGGLEVGNEEFVGVECIVAMEVVEHLNEDVLLEFAPILLGVYHPRILLVTTPNFTFNARFHPPDTPESRVGGYPDPTGRTDRIFRHHDHKFEWTVDEFKQWCTSIAEEWGYTVDVDGVGKAVEPDEWGREEKLGYASQVAKFTRIEGEEWRALRAREAREVAKRASQKTKHELLKTHQYNAHPQTRQPVSLDEIGEAIKSKMQDFRRAVVRLEELWFENEIAVMCGGWFEFLLAAVERHKDLELMTEEGGGRAEWEVELIGGLKEEPEPLWDQLEQDEWESEETVTESGTAEAREDPGIPPDWGVSWGAGEATAADTGQSGWGNGDGWGNVEARTGSSIGWS